MNPQADDRHVSDQEARLARLEPAVAPAAEPSLLPSRKWLSARVVALAALATMWATTGAWDLEETVALIGLVTEAAVSFLTPNDPTPGGVPER